jgi:uncharacterized iron-regulated protein
MLGNSMMRRLFLATLVASALVLFFHVPVSPSADHSPAHEFHAGQVIEVKTGHSIPFDDWMAALLDQEVIYLGEEHRNQWHVEAALRILKALLSRGRQPALALEMFGWDGQAGLNQYLSDPEMTRDQFLHDSRWEQNWGGPFDDYAPLIVFARARRTPVLALNPPRPLVRRVASHGLARVFEEEDMNRLGLKKEALVEDQAYRDVILKQLRLCHSGLSEEAYQRMYEASMFRDEGMAKTIADHLSRILPESGTATGPLLSYTGSGHIQYRLPVPHRVLRRKSGLVKQTTVYLTSIQTLEEVHHLVRESIADYLWLTPIGAHGAPQHCR